MTRMPQPIQLSLWADRYHPEVSIAVMPHDDYDAAQNAVNLARMLVECTPNTSFELLVEFLGRQVWHMLQFEHTAELMTLDPAFARDHIRGFLHMLANGKPKQNPK